MTQKEPLSPLERKKLAEELYHQYIAWGNEALGEGQRARSERYYQQAEYCLHLINSLKPQVIESSSALPAPKEGELSYKKPNLQVIQGGKPSLPSTPTPNPSSVKASRIPPSRKRSKIIAIINFEGPSAKEASNQMSEEERQARYQRMLAVTRAQHKLTGLAKRYRSFSELDCPLPDGKKT